jgi:hypothetical protein
MAVEESRTSTRDDLPMGWVWAGVFAVVAIFGCIALGMNRCEMTRAGVATFHSLPAFSRSEPVCIGRRRIHGLHGKRRRDPKNDG